MSETLTYSISGAGNTIFPTGNFNKFENIITEVFPQKLSLIREEVLPKVKDMFLSMLGRIDSVEAKSLDGSFVIDEEEFKGIQISLSFIVKDFIVPTAPDEAVKADCEAIKKAMNAANVTIDTSTGETVINIQYPIDEEEVEDGNEN